MVFLEKNGSPGKTINATESRSIGRAIPGGEGQKTASMSSGRLPGERRGALKWFSLAIPYVNGSFSRRRESPPIHALYQARQAGRLHQVCDLSAAKDA
jgi:hypothetical protein